MKPITILFQTIQVLEELVEPGLDTTQVIFRMKAAVASKHFGQEDILCRIVAQVNIANSAVVSASVAILPLS